MTSIIRPEKDKFKVLHVEDDLLLSEVYKDNYHRHGISSDIFHDPVDALSSLNSNPNQYHLIISDFHLPNMNGIEFIKKAFSLTEGKGIPFAILSSALEDDFFIKEYQKAGNSFVESVTLIDKLPLDFGLAPVPLTFREFLLNKQEIFCKQRNLEAS